MLNRHGFQRIFDLCPTVKTHAVGLASECENTAEVAVMATKQEIKDDYEPRDKRFEHRPDLLQRKTQIQSLRVQVGYQSGSLLKLLLFLPM